MIKTQVQIPDKLYREAKRVAQEREWSFAEVMRRGLEYMTRTHPPVEAHGVELPVLPAKAFADDFDQLDLRALADADETARSL